MPVPKTTLALLTVLIMACLAGCAGTATAPQASVDQGSRLDVGAICSAIDNNPEGKVDKKEFCSYFKEEQELAAKTFDDLDTQKKGYITKKDVRIKQRELDQVIRLTTPR